MRYGGLPVIGSSSASLCDAERPRNTSDQSTNFDPEAAQYLSAASLAIPDAFVELAWLGHAPFAFHLMAVLQPRVYVELGTYAGFSYFCFCQAAKEYRTGTATFAVDTWEGDEHSGFYSEEIYHSVKRLNEPYLPFSTLMRMRFNEALSYFSDGCVDLLHIDGRRYYDDVKEDFESWLPKLSKNAVVLFNDTNARECDFGVFRLFRELGETYPTFEFFHSHGLGVLARGAVPLALKPFFEADRRQATIFRGLYSELGRHMFAMWRGAQPSVTVTQTDGELAALRSELDRMRESLVDAERRLLVMTKDRNDLAKIERGHREDLDRIRSSLESSNARVAELENELDRLNQKFRLQQAQAEDQRDLGGRRFGAIRSTAKSAEGIEQSVSPRLRAGSQAPSVVAVRWRFAPELLRGTLYFTASKARVHSKLISA